MPNINHLMNDILAGLDLAKRNVLFLIDGENLRERGDLLSPFNLISSIEVLRITLKNQGMLRKILRKYLNSIRIIFIYKNPQTRLHFNRQYGESIHRNKISVVYIMDQNLTLTYYPDSNSIKGRKNGEQSPSKPLTVASEIESELKTMGNDGKHRFLHAIANQTDDILLILLIQKLMELQQTKHRYLKFVGLSGDKFKMDEFAAIYEHFWYYNKTKTATLRYRVSNKTHPDTLLELSQSDIRIFLHNLNDSLPYFMNKNRTDADQGTALVSDSNSLTNILHSLFDHIISTNNIEIDKKRLKSNSFIISLEKIEAKRVVAKEFVAGHIAHLTNDDKGKIEGWQQKIATARAEKIKKQSNVEGLRKNVVVLENELTTLRAKLKELENPPLGFKMTKREEQDRKQRVVQLRSDIGMKQKQFERLQANLNSVESRISELDKYILELEKKITAKNSLKIETARNSADQLLLLEPGPPDVKQPIFQDSRSGFYQIPTQRDGNCLFNSLVSLIIFHQPLGECLNSVLGGSPLGQLVMRQLIMGHLEEFLNVYDPLQTIYSNDIRAWYFEYIIGGPIDYQIPLDTIITQYKATMSHGLVNPQFGQSIWGGALEMSVLIHIFRKYCGINLNITIHNLQEQTIIPINFGQVLGYGNIDINLAYDGTHYEPLVPNGIDKPPGGGAKIKYLKYKKKYLKLKEVYNKMIN